MLIDSDLVVTADLELLIFRGHWNNGGCPLLWLAFSKMPIFSN